MKRSRVLGHTAVKTAWEPTADDLQTKKSPDVCPRCGLGDQREHLMQTTGVGFYRCAACGHMFIVRTSLPKVETTP